jgi:hypothetical protein
MHHPIQFHTTRPDAPQVLLLAEDRVGCWIDGYVFNGIDDVTPEESSSKIQLAIKSTEVDAGLCSGKPLRIQEGIISCDDARYAE